MIPLIITLAVIACFVLFMALLFAMDGRQERRRLAELEEFRRINRS